MAEPIPTVVDLLALWRAAGEVVFAPGLFLVAGIAGAIVTPVVVSLGVSSNTTRREAIVNRLLSALKGHVETAPRDLWFASRRGKTLPILIGLTVALGFCALQIVHATGRLVPGEEVAAEEAAADQAELEEKIREEVAVKDDTTTGTNVGAPIRVDGDVAEDPAPHPKGPLASSLASLHAVAPMIDADWFRFAVIGFLGAYFNLWRETIVRMRNSDLTEVALANMTRSLITGSLLGAVVPASIMSAQGVTADGLAFLVGAFPGPAEAVLRRAANRAFSLDGEAGLPRPLSKLSGMTPDVLERLDEAGITDAQHLCYRNPFFLIARLPYGPRQIVDWIDEALLFRYLPADAFGKRGSAGLTGAIDLLTILAKDPPPADGAASADDEDPLEDGPLVLGPEVRGEAGQRQALATALGMDEAALLRVGALLESDRQFQLIRRLEALHQLSDPSLGKPDAPTTESRNPGFFERLIAARVAKRAADAEAKQTADPRSGDENPNG